MADEPKTEPTTPAPTADPPKVPDKTFTQADLDRVVQERLDRERKKYEGYDELKAKAAQYDELSEKDKTEAQKLQGKLSKAEQDKADAEARLLRYEVATEKQIPGDALDLLTGTTREELEAKADKLLELTKNAQATPEFDGGARDPAPEPKTPEQAHNDLAVSLFGQPRI